MKISQEDAILIKNLYLSKQYGARRLLSEFPDKGWKLGSIDSLLKRIRKTRTIVRQPGSGRQRSSRSTGGPCAQLHGGPQALVRGSICPPLENIQAIFDSFCFAQKVPKSLPQDTFHGSKHT